MDTDTTVIETTVETPSFLRRVPVKKIVVVTLVVAGAVALAKYAKDNVEIDKVEIPDVTTS